MVQWVSSEDRVTAATPPPLPLPGLSLPIFPETGGYRDLTLSLSSKWPSAGLFSIHLRIATFCSPCIACSLPVVSVICVCECVPAFLCVGVRVCMCVNVTTARGLVIVTAWVPVLSRFWSPAYSIICIMFPVYSLSQHSNVITTTDPCSYKDPSGYLLTCVSA